MESKASRGFIPHIEGLRSVAVLLVLFYHAGTPFLPGGFIGVDIFFVISGFLITGILIREIEETGMISLSRFYARRIRRLLPAATLVLITTLVAAWLIIPPLRWRTVAVDGLTSALWTGNIRFALSQTDYLTANDTPSPLLHFWSLGVEEQFYLIWPLLLVAVSAITWRWMTARTAVAITASVVVIASFITALNWTDSQQPYAFFLLPSRAWELATGALLAAATPLIPRINRYIRILLGGLGLITILASAVILDKTVQWPGVSTLVPVAAAVAIIASVGLPARSLSIPPFLAIGRWSYSLYLWHWPVLVLAPIALDRVFTLAESLLALLASAVIAVISYHWVENPLRSHRLIVRPWRSLALGSALVATTAAGACTEHCAPSPCHRHYKHPVSSVARGGTLHGDSRGIHEGH